MGQAAQTKGPAPTGAGPIRRRAPSKEDAAADAAFHPIQDLQALGGHLAALLVGGQFELDLLTFAQIADPGALQRADVDEGILATVIRRNEAKALLGVKPLNGSRRHEETLS